MNVDIIIPVFRGYETTRQCVESVLANTDMSCARVVLINDASPEEALVRWCQEIAREPGVELVTQRQNQGFVASVNLGMSLSDERDVVLLNSDTRVPANWLPRLLGCAYSRDDIATVTPFSNNGSICSYPHFCGDAEIPAELDLDTLDSLFAEANAGKYTELPTAVGFCMYIRRQCLDEVGDFDVERFGKGYGEENDFSLRAVAAGWRNVLCADLFVYHEGGVSFGETRDTLMAAATARVLEKHPGYAELVAKFIALDPVAPYRDAVDSLRADLPGQARVLLEEWQQAREDFCRRQVQLQTTVSRYESSLEECGRKLEELESLILQQRQAVENYEGRCQEYVSLLEREREAFSQTDQELSNARQIIGERDEANRALREELERINAFWSVRLERKLFRK